MNELPTKEDLDALERREWRILVVTLIASLVAFVWVFATISLPPEMARTGKLADLIGESDDLEYVLYAADELGLDVILVDAGTSSDVTIQATYYAGRYAIAGIDGTTVYVYNLFEVYIDMMVRTIVAIFAATATGCVLARYDNYRYDRLVYEQQLEARRREMRAECAQTK